MKAVLLDPLLEPPADFPGRDPGVRHTGPSTRVRAREALRDREAEQRAGGADSRGRHGAQARLLGWEHRRCPGQKGRSDASCRLLAKGAPRTPTVATEARGPEKPIAGECGSCTSCVASGRFLGQRPGTPQACPTCGLPCGPQSRPAPVPPSCTLSCSVRPGRARGLQGPTSLQTEPSGVLRRRLGGSVTGSAHQGS